MSIITISRASCSKGRIIAESVAENLGFECLSREILLETSDRFNVPQPALLKALYNGPNLIDRFSPGKERYITMIKAALLNRLKHGNIVYHGLAGHFLVREVPQILKIRILAEMGDRIIEEMQRDQVSEMVARARLAKEDRERNSWSHYFCNMTPSDSELYDLVINLKEISVDECVTMICNTITMEKFRFTEDARKQLEDMAFAASIKATLVTKYDSAIVTSHSGRVFIKLPQATGGIEKTKEDIEELLSDIHGIQDIHFEMKSNAPPRTAMHK